MEKTLREVLIDTVADYVIGTDVIADSVSITTKKEEHYDFRLTEIGIHFTVLTDDVRMWESLIMDINEEIRRKCKKLKTI